MKTTAQRLREFARKLNDLYADNPISSDASRVVDNARNQLCVMARMHELQEENEKLRKGQAVALEDTF